MLMARQVNDLSRVRRSARRERDECIGCLRAEMIEVECFAACAGEKLYGTAADRAAYLCKRCTLAAILVMRQGLFRSL